MLNHAMTAEQNAEPVDAAGNMNQLENKGMNLQVQDDCKAMLA
jgi:hypothetical protein